eukprot:GHVU01070744.1.p1 GENE.GHVU01070744.1~~GHVU01070744.1.p1  ORF type:complete len:143 (+),score=17.79 GHVU01070744.1:273-701(+)
MNACTLGEACTYNSTTNVRTTTDSAAEEVSGGAHHLQERRRDDMLLLIKSYERLEFHRNGTLSLLRMQRHLNTRRISEGVNNKRIKKQDELINGYRNKLSKIRKSPYSDWLTETVVVPGYIQDAPQPIGQLHSFIPHCRFRS